MEPIKDIFRFLNNPHHVWKFQQFFGLRKVSEVKTSEEGHWVALDSRSIPRPLPERVRIPTQPTITQSSFEREYRINQRVRAVRKQQSNEDDESRCSSGYSSEGEPEESASVLYYKIGSYFWYNLFQAASGLGDETFCAPVFIFIILNLDGNVGRRVLFIYCLLMYFGQALKDTIKWQRPSMPPVIQMERKWALEYGMPSTHAMVALGIPVSFFVFSNQEYPVELSTSLLSTFVWCSLVSCSRIYLGMHSIADILAGLLLSALLLPLLMYIALYLDFWLVSSPLSAPVTLLLSFLAIWIYPSSGRWTPARGETTAILGSYIGAQMGFWLLVQLGYLTTGGMKEAFVWERWNLAYIVIRSVIGGIVGGIAKTGSKPVWIRFSCYLAGIDHRRYENSRNLFVELFYKFWSYATLGMMVVSVSPLTFSILGIQRESFLSELTP